MSVFNVVVHVWRRPVIVSLLLGITLTPDSTSVVLSTCVCVRVIT